MRPLTDEERLERLEQRRKDARIRYRMSRGKTYEEAVADDKGDNYSVIMVGDVKLSDMVTRPAYLRIYNKILNKKSVMEAVESERKNHPECFLTQEQLEEKKASISVKRRLAALGKKQE